MISPVTGSIITSSNSPVVSVTAISISDQARPHTPLIKQSHAEALRRSLSPVASSDWAEENYGFLLSTVMYQIGPGQSRQEGCSRRLCRARNCLKLRTTRRHRRFSSRPTPATYDRGRRAGRRVGVAAGPPRLGLPQFVSALFLPGGHRVSFVLAWEDEDRCQYQESSDDRE